jgi:hypothetical protein
MPTLIPGSKPRLSATALNARIGPLGVDRTKHPVVIVGLRGYYKNSMGAPGVNDRGIYDDAIFIDTPSGTIAYNGNTDPSRYRKGRRRGAGKGMASLKPGVWYAHRFGKHRRQYLALCQLAGDVTVTRRRPSLRGHRAVRHQHPSRLPRRNREPRLPDHPPGSVAELHQHGGRPGEALFRRALEPGDDPLHLARGLMSPAAAGRERAGSARRVRSSTRPDAGSA